MLYFCKYLVKGGVNLKISTKGRYALRMLIDLAMHQNDGYIALKDIAARQNISKKYLEQIMPILNKADVLLTNRGFQGGYRLARTPDQYTVGEILRITEGSLAPVACLDHDPNTCPMSDECITYLYGRVLTKSLQSILTVLQFRILLTIRPKALAMTM